MDVQASRSLLNIMNFSLPAKMQYTSLHHVMKYVHTFYKSVNSDSLPKKTEIKPLFTYYFFSNYSLTFGII